jgi:hypothetical protein
MEGGDMQMRDKYGQKMSPSGSLPDGVIRRVGQLEMKADPEHLKNVLYRAEEFVCHADTAVLGCGKINVPARTK